MLSSLPVLRASPSEKTLKLAMVFLSGSEFSVSTESTLRNASRAACVMPWPAPGSAIKRRHRAGVRQQRAAFQRNDGNAGQALEFQTDLGVGAHRRRRGHRDRRIDAARIVRREAEIGDLTDADAVEQHRGADQQPRHRAVELDVIGRARTEPAGIVQPVDEAEYGERSPPVRRRRQRRRERGFPSLNSLWVAASGSACRENRPAPRDARIEAVRASVRWRRSCRPPAPRRDRRPY